MKPTLACPRGLVSITEFLPAIGSCMEAARSKGKNTPFQIASIEPVLGGNNPCKKFGSSPFQTFEASDILEEMNSIIVASLVN